MVQTEKFDIVLETDAGRQELLNYIRRRDIEFKDEDEERILKRMRFIARELSLKSFSELLKLFKDNSEDFESALEWLQRGKVYNDRINHYYPLVKRKKTITDYTQITTKKKKKSKKAARKRKFDAMLKEFPITYGDPVDPDNLSKLLDILDKKKVNYQAYKINYLLRRIHHRMRRNETNSYKTYSELIDKDPDELVLLLKSFSINVTRFFRNKDMYTALDKNILPVIFRENAGSINIWSAGCAVGAEPYSIAMLVDSKFNSKDRRRTNIIATDISIDLLNKAKEGLFDKELMKEVSPDKLHAYFQKKGGYFAISPKLKMYTKFQSHDLRTPTPAHNLDLILCRNVLIYFSQEESLRLFERLYVALKPKGFLVLGKCEMMRGKVRDEFEVVDARNRIYRKKE